MAIRRQIDVECIPTVKEIIEEIWEMNSEQQTELLVYLYDYLSTYNGQLQLAAISNYLDNHAQSAKDKIHYVVEKLSDYLMEENKDGKQKTF